MNNEQFRKLLLAKSAKAFGEDKNASQSTSSRLGGSTPITLGSRQKSSIPMTPRAVSGRVDFAQQLAERNQGSKQPKNFRTSAPKGSKLAQGYTDRAGTRQQEEDEPAERLSALEELLKKEEINQETYDKLRMQIAGGDLSSTHLVKGLDFKLLERIRNGEDAYNESKPKTSDVQSESEPEGDPDGILDELEGHEVKPVEREKAQKKGQFAPMSLVPGQKRRRDQILAEMKAAREAAKAKEESSLGSRFKKIGARPKPGSRIERDNRGREVLIIVDEDGNERRKVRKVGPSPAKEGGKETFRPDKNAEVLGMEVPEFYKQQQLAKASEEEEKEFNIFDDAGSDYDPLNGLNESDDEKSSGEEGNAEGKQDLSPEKETAYGKGENTSSSSPPKPPHSTVARNYFKDSKTALTSAEPSRATSLSDPTIVAALKKARAHDTAARSEEEVKAAEREARLKKMLENSARDDEDLDIGFGTNRLEDEAEMDETKVKLSTWGDNGDEDGAEGGKTKRKRGPKKRKGDKNSYSDVLRVMERRKANGDGGTTMSP